MQIQNAPSFVGLQGPIRDASVINQWIGIDQKKLFCITVAVSIGRKWTFVKANLVSAPNLIMEARANFIFISVATIAKTKTQAVITTPIKEVEVQMLIVMCAAKKTVQVEGE